MSSALHSKQTTSDGIHTPISYVYSNSSTRSSASGFNSDDIGKFARQLDDNSIWMLIEITPTWVAVGSSTSLELATTMPLILDVSTGSIGSGSTVSRTDHKHSILAFTPVSASVGSINFEGLSSSFARSDHTHQILRGTPSAVGTANFAGTGTLFVAQDHIHKANYQQVVNTSNVASTERSVIKFTGDGVELSDDGTRTVVTIAGGAGPSTSGWQTAVDIDFTALPSQTMATDGDYTIAGLTWTKTRSANEYAAMQLLSGTGLVVYPQPVPASGSYSVYNQQHPHIFTAFENIVPGFNPNANYRMWIYASSSNRPVNTDDSVYTFIGIQPVADGWTSNRQYGLSLIGQNSDYGAQGHRGSSIATTWENNDPYQVAMMEIFNGFTGPFSISSTFTMSSGSWPNLLDMYHNSADTSHDGYIHNIPRDFVIGLGGVSDRTWNASAATAARCVIYLKRLKIEYYV